MALSQKPDPEKLKLTHKKSHTTGERHVETHHVIFRYMSKCKTAVKIYIKAQSSLKTEKCQTRHSCSGHKLTFKELHVLKTKI